MFPQRYEPLPAPFYTQKSRDSGRLWELWRMTLGLRPLLLQPKWDVSHEKLGGRHLQIRTWHFSRAARQATSQNSNSVLLVDHSTDRMQTKEKEEFGLKEDSVTAQYSGCNQRQLDKPGRWWRRGCLSLPIRASQCCLQRLHRVFSLGVCALHQMGKG